MQKKSWKTTIAGVVAVAAAVVTHFFPEHQGIFTTIIAAATGLGLIAARDNKVTSEEVGAK